VGVDVMGTGRVVTGLGAGVGLGSFVPDGRLGRGAGAGFGAGFGRVTGIGIDGWGRAVDPGPPPNPNIRENQLSCEKSPDNQPAGDASRASQPDRHPGTRSTMSSARMMTMTAVMRRFRRSIQDEDRHSLGPLSRTAWA